MPSFTWIPKIKISGFSCLLFSLLLSLLVPSCHYFRAMVGVEPLPPKVSLTAVNVKTFDGRNLNLQAIIKVFNPNDFDIKFKNLKYSFRLKNENGKKIAEGSKREELTLKSEKSVDVSIDLKFDSLELLSSVLNQLSRSRSVGLFYQVSGHFDGPLGYIEIHRSGKIEKKI